MGVPSHSCNLYVGTGPPSARRTKNTSSVQPGKYPFLKGRCFLFNRTRSPTLRVGRFCCCNRRAYKWSHTVRSLARVTRNGAKPMLRCGVALYPRTSKGNRSTYDSVFIAVNMRYMRSFKVRFQRSTTAALLSLCVEKCSMPLSFKKD